MNKVGIRHLAVSGRGRVYVCVLLSAHCLLACSVPNLEPPECTASRDIVKEFYSFHFGNDMKFSEENLKLRERFLTPEFAAALKNLQTENDVFTTNSPDFPKAFRTAACEVFSPERTIFSIVFFWRDDTRSEQKEIKVETAKHNDKWLISRIVN